ncbi:hypothetical protein NC974_09150 [Leptolyngbya sp. SLC-A1]|nr:MULTISPECIES: hypothetical protein [Cyanophyceae]MBD1916464.1 hypothetical protein [Phormidium sp. FACHB-77]MBD2052911.1 hypothetical protein [Leptolyngbya sp. FACHB-60]
MNNYTRKTQLLFYLSGVFLLIWSAIAGYNRLSPQPNTGAIASTPNAVSSPATSVVPAAPSTPGVQQWRSILKGESAQGLTFSQEGQLLYQEKLLLNEIPVSYTSDGTVTYAQRLFVSEPSPSGRFNVFKACEGLTDETGLCWAVFLVDREAGKVQQISIAKYGGQNWVQWSPDERYAVFAESMEGVTWFIALDLQTGESKMFDYTVAPADLSSFTWVSDRTFKANFLCDAECAEPPFQGDITKLFAE